MTTIKTSFLPQAVKERGTVVANTAARLALTTAEVQNGDSVYQSDSERWYLVHDEAQLGTEAAFLPLPSGVTTGGIVMPKASGTGIKVDFDAPTYGWRDLTGELRVRATGPTVPTWAIYRSPLYQYQFTVNQECFFEFHIPHDYVPGTNLFVHAHWSHASTTVTSGGVTWGFDASYAKGHQQSAFVAPVSTSAAQNASTTQYTHMIAEVAISDATPSGSRLDTSLIEPDGLILLRCVLSANNMNGTPAPFLHFVDLHYQSTNMPTKNKAPNFYT